MSSSAPTTCPRAWSSRMASATSRCCAPRGGRARCDGARHRLRRRCASRDARTRRAGRALGSQTLVLERHARHRANGLHADRDPPSSIAGSKTRTASSSPSALQVCDARSGVDGIGHIGGVPVGVDEDHRRSERGRREREWDRVGRERGSVRSWPSGTPRPSSTARSAIEPRARRVGEDAGQKDGGDRRMEEGQRGGAEHDADTLPRLPGSARPSSGSTPRPSSSGATTATGSSVVAAQG